MLRKKLLGGLAVATAAGLLLSACANQSGGDSSGGSDNSSRVNIPAVSKVDVPQNAVLPKGDGKAQCPADTTLTYVGAMTGPNAQLGINIYNGVQLAINQHNEANPGCQVKFQMKDTEGSPDKAPGVVSEVVNDKNTIGVVGLPFSGESKATGNIFEQAGLVHITPAATAPVLTTNGWKTFFRGLGNDAVQGPAAAKFMLNQLQGKKIYVVQDDSEYGIGLGTQVTDAIKSADSGKLAGTDKVNTGQKDFSAVISKIQNAKADVVYYAGYYAEGAPFDQQLVGKGWNGTFVGPDGVKDDQFLKQAGDASSNAYFTCPCIPGELISSFATEYKKLSKGQEPGTYSIEGYDVATVLLAGIDAGKQTRSDLLAWVKSYDKDGLSKHYKWDDKGELQAPTVYGYKVENQKIVPIGPVGQ